MTKKTWLFCGSDHAGVFMPCLQGSNAVDLAVGSSTTELVIFHRDFSIFVHGNFPGDIFFSGWIHGVFMVLNGDFMVINGD